VLSGALSKNVVVLHYCKMAITFSGFVNDRREMQGYNHITPWPNTIYLYMVRGLTEWYNLCSVLTGH